VASASFNQAELAVALHRDLQLREIDQNAPLRLETAYGQLQLTLGRRGTAGALAASAEARARARKILCMRRTFCQREEPSEGTPKRNLTPTCCWAKPRHGHTVFGSELDKNRHLPFPAQLNNEGASPSRECDAERKALPRARGFEFSRDYARSAFSPSQEQHEKRVSGTIRRPVSSACALGRRGLRSQRKGTAWGSRRVLETARPRTQCSLGRSCAGRVAPPSPRRALAHRKDHENGISVCAPARPSRHEAKIRDL
jgi:hypothetical protein